MGFKEKMINLKNKTADVFFTARMTYEENCIDVDCFYQSNIKLHDDIKAKVDTDKMEISFSGVLDIELKDVPKPWFFMLQDGRYFTLDDTSIKQETIDIQLKSKVDKYVITTAKFEFKQLLIK